METIHQPLARSGGFQSATYAVSAVLLAAALAAGWLEMSLALLPLAALLGWSHLSSV